MVYAVSGWGGKSACKALLVHAATTLYAQAKVLSEGLLGALMGVYEGVGWRVMGAALPLHGVSSYFTGGKSVNRLDKTSEIGALQRVSPECAQAARTRA